MSESPLHVVFGTGQVGRALTERLAGLGLPVRAVSRHRPATLADGVDWRPADATDPDVTIDAAKGASTVYQCLNAPYTKWPQAFPPLQRSVLAAAERADAVLVSLENIYGYGPTGGSGRWDRAGAECRRGAGRRTAVAPAARRSGRRR
jgi:nucleoside-diphosphate-sugar epimerase